MFATLTTLFIYLFTIYTFQLDMERNVSSLVFEKLKVFKKFL